MSELNINVAGGSSTRLLTAGKYCDKDILIVASGSEAEPAVIEALEITANGTYTAPEGVDGYSPVTVNVPQDGGPPEEAFLITGNCECRFANSGWDWFITQHGSKITTENISNAKSMFLNDNYRGELPFDLNFIDGGCDCTAIFQGSNFTRIPPIDFKQSKTYKTMGYLFAYSNDVTEIGKLSNGYPTDLNYFLYDCRMLRHMPEIENWNWSRIHTYAYSNLANMFTSCYSLRVIPESFLKEIYGTQSSVSYIVSNGAFSKCYALDEVRGLRLSNYGASVTSNAFNTTFNNCCRLKDIIFDMEDGIRPYECNWKQQTIDLTQDVGYMTIASTNYATEAAKTNVCKYNSGITPDKAVYDDATYQALKNDPDWFAMKMEYSRYNHDSAVNTINSLPDTSLSGAANIIKFRGAAGSLTDGGAINTLTAEEIAVATAKGWTVTLV